MFIQSKRESFYTANKADGHAYTDTNVNLMDKRYNKSGSTETLNCQATRSVFRKLC